MHLRSSAPLGARFGQYCAAGVVSAHHCLPVLVVIMRLPTSEYASFALPNHFALLCLKHEYMLHATSFMQYFERLSAGLHPLNLIIHSPLSNIYECC